MKIILVNDYGYELGGAETHFFALAKLLKKEHQVLTVTSDYIHTGKKIISDKQISASGNFYDLDRLFNLKNFWEFKKIIKEFQPNVIHFHNIFYQLSPSIIKAANGIKRVMTLHDYCLICDGQKINSDRLVCDLRYTRCKNCKLQKPERLINKLKNISARCFSKEIEAFIAPSKYLQGQFEKNDFLNLNLIPHFVSLESDLEITNSNEKHFLFLGRLVKQKGIDCIIKAFSHAKLENIKLYIVGEGEDFSYLESIVSELQLTEKVVFLGRIDGFEKKLLLANCIANLLPSQWPEVAGLTIYEAAVYGRPTIASDIGGIKDFIINDFNGILITQNDERSWAQAMIDLASNNHLKANILGIKALETVVRCHSPANYLRKVNIIYQK